MATLHECEVCGFIEPGPACPACYMVTPVYMEALAFETISWGECPDHGAFPVEGLGRPSKVSWTERDPKDRRRKVEKGYWVYPCPQHDWRGIPGVKLHKEKFARRPEDVERDRAERTQKYNEALARARQEA